MHDMRALFVICPSMGIGEVFTCIKLSKQLADAGVQVYHIGTEVITEFSYINSDKRIFFKTDINGNTSMINGVINEFKPDFIVFADYYMYIKNPLLISILDFNCIKDSKLPCIIVDTFGNCKLNGCDTSIYKDDSISVVLPECICGILRPVPPHDFKTADGESKVRHFSVFLEKDAKKNRTIYESKKKFGLNPAGVTVIFPLGHWVKQIAIGVELRLYQNLLRIVSYYLNILEVPIDLCLLGGSGNEKSQYPNICLHNSFKNLSFEETDDLIRVSDLLITVNRFSNSLGRAALFNTPTLTFINSSDIGVYGNKILTDLDYEVSPYIKKIMRLITQQNGTIKKFMLFPESRTETIDEFYKANPHFGSINPVCELFDENNAGRLLRSLIIDKDCKLQNVQKDFMEGAFALPSAYNSIKELIYGKCNNSF